MSATTVVQTDVGALKTSTSARTGVGGADIAVVTVVLAVVAILSLFTVFAALAGSMPVVVFCALTSAVLCVAVAFHQLRRAGI